MQYIILYSVQCIMYIVYNPQYPSGDRVGRMWRAGPAIKLLCVKIPESPHDRRSSKSRRTFKDENIRVDIVLKSYLDYICISRCCGALLLNFYYCTH